ncbi:MAG: hypothetical protein QM723_34310 [Myxococcaceae bacterium]
MADIKPTDAELRIWAQDHGWKVEKLTEGGKHLWRWRWADGSEADPVQIDAEGSHDAAPAISAKLREELSAHQEEVREEEQFKEEEEKNKHPDVQNQIRAKVLSDPHHAGDWFLEHIAKLANDVSVGPSITLSVGGILISGSVISGKQFFQEVTALMKEALSRNPSLKGKAADSIEEWYRAQGAIYNRKTPRGARVSYIHLKDARYHHPSGNPLPTSGSTLWRGKIRAVDGFQMGAFSAPTSDDEG